MQERYPPEAITHADIAIIRTNDGHIAAGVLLVNRYRLEDGRMWNEPYRVLSLFYDDLKTPTIRQAIPVISNEILSQLAPQTKLCVFRSGNPHFQRRHELEAAVGLFAMQHSVTVKFKFKRGFYRIVQDLQLLANDAIERKSSVISAV